jgi:hypothetical protein
MTQRVPEFTTFMERTGSLGSRVRTNSTGEGELLEESLHAFDVFRDVGIDFRVGAFEVAVGEDGGRSVAWRRGKLRY